MRNPAFAEIEAAAQAAPLVKVELLERLRAARKAIQEAPDWMMTDKLIAAMWAIEEAEKDDV